MMGGSGWCIKKLGFGTCIKYSWVLVAVPLYCCKVSHTTVYIVVSEKKSC